MLARQVPYNEITKLLQFTVSIRKSRRQTQFTSSLVCEDRLLFQLISRFFMRAESSKMTGRNPSACIHFFFFW
jgi:hypothetical protein